MKKVKMKKEDSVSAMEKHENFFLCAVIQTRKASVYAGWEAMSTEVVAIASDKPVVLI
ncbi:MAG: hypothetical protein LBT25_06860 [Candidatus Symbiothrix sp.]|jgi:hypothetical protein|nr:hypothetical protein [Candidatus Symbiothrix sp.]